MPGAASAADWAPDAARPTPAAVALPRRVHQHDQHRDQGNACDHQEDVVVGQDLGLRVAADASATALAALRSAGSVIVLP